MNIPTIHFPNNFGGLRESFQRLNDEEPEIARLFTGQYAACAGVLLLSVPLSFILSSASVFLMCLAVCACGGAVVTYRLFSTLTGKVSVYTGVVVKTEDAALSARNMIPRSSAVIRNDNGMYVTFHPGEKKSPFCEGDIVSVYAHESAFTQSDENMGSLSGYWHVKVLEYADPAQPG